MPKATIKINYWEVNSLGNIFFPFTSIMLTHACVVMHENYTSVLLLNNRCLELIYVAASKHV